MQIFSTSKRYDFCKISGINKIIFTIMSQASSMYLKNSFTSRWLSFWLHYIYKTTNLFPDNSSNLPTFKVILFFISFLIFLSPQLASDKIWRRLRIKIERNVLCSLYWTLWTLIEICCQLYVQAIHGLEQMCHWDTRNWHIEQNCEKHMGDVFWTDSV